MSKLTETIRETILSAINEMQSANNADIAAMRAIHARIIGRTDELRDLNDVLCEVVKTVDEIVEMNEDNIGTSPDTELVPTYEEAEAIICAREEEEDELFEDDEDTDEDTDEDAEDSDTDGENK